MAYAARALFVVAIVLAIGGAVGVYRGFGRASLFEIIIGLSSGFWPFVAAVAIDRVDRALRQRDAA
ncbi:hypothetical protein [Novosphingobium aerophilum]|uniref:hypothetical protein n=1 Tax=Novosphingobium aerophilum TaxID=2839843 RepID=UPI00163A67F8|nr:hypothetical protein [Novosphingobium aerophilum]